jgi:hypothetical protein
VRRVLWLREALKILRGISRFDTECRGDVMDLFGFFRKPIPCGDPEWNGLAFDIDDPRIPEAIRAAASSMYQLGMAMYFHATTQGGEWWLMDGDNIVEAFWLE